MSSDIRERIARARADHQHPLHEAASSIKRVMAEYRLAELDFIIDNHDHGDIDPRERVREL